jgi:hypothetical protein
MTFENDADVHLTDRCVDQGKEDAQSYGKTQAKVRSFQRYEMLNDRRRGHRRFHSRFYPDYRTLPAEGLKCGEKGKHL